MMDEIIKLLEDLLLELYFRNERQIRIDNGWELPSTLWN